MNEPRLNLPELTVSELSAALKRTIEDSYGYVRVRGELGKVSYHGNGHVYFDLKDDRASIAGVVWRSTAPRIKLKLEAGLEVVITGRLQRLDHDLVLRAPRIGGHSPGNHDFEAGFELELDAR